MITSRIPQFLFKKEISRTNWPVKTMFDKFPPQNIFLNLRFQNIFNQKNKKKTEGIYSDHNHRDKMHLMRIVKTISLWRSALNLQLLFDLALILLKIDKTSCLRNSIKKNDHLPLEVGENYQDVYLSNLKKHRRRWRLRWLYR